MHHIAPFYLIGITVALLMPHGPGWTLAVALLLAALVLALPAGTRSCAALLAGFAWASLHVAAYRGALPAVDQAGHAVPIRGQVMDFARTAADGAAFVLTPPADGLKARLAAVKVAVRGYPGTPPPPGAWCELRVVLGQPRGLANPGTEDRERAYAARRIAATARVVSHPANLCAPIAPAVGFAARRARFAAAIDAAVTEPRLAAVIRALAIADRSALDERHWALVRATGTAHLLAISGLHVALAGMLAFTACRLLGGAFGWRRQAYPALRPAWLGAAVAACVYAGLAGGGVPARRAALMVVLAACAALGGRRVLSFQHLVVALAVLATLDPFALLGAGLWLSFGAVAILLWLGLRVRHGQGAWRTAWRAHLALAFGMAPLLGAVFGEVPLIAPLANLVAVPWCSVLVVPLVLVGLLTAGISPPLAALAWDMAARCWGWLETFLALTAGLQLNMRLDALPATALVLLAGGFVACASPRGLGLRRLGLVLIIAAACARPPRPAPGAFEVQVLDVGQGLAVLVRTAGHAVLYDAGPRWWPSGEDAGRAVVVPVLRRLGQRRLDAVAISHTDGDHVGGLSSVLAALPVARVYAPPAAMLPGGVAATPCVDGADWIWDGVTFRWLDAGIWGARTSNDGSCVLQVTGAHGRLLLSGDIEQRSETALVARHGDGLAADLLVVPHHGSITSSTPAFIAAVAPTHAVIASGYANRYGLPHATVVARYRAAGARIHDTAPDGAITVAVAAAGIHVRAVRHARIGFWSRLDAGRTARPAAPLSATERVW